MFDWMEPTLFAEHGKWTLNGDDVMTNSFHNL